MARRGLLAARLLADPGGRGVCARPLRAGGGSSGVEKNNSRSNARARARARPWRGKKATRTRCMHWRGRGRRSLCARCARARARAPAKKFKKSGISQWATPQMSRDFKKNGRDGKKKKKCGKKNCAPVWLHLGVHRHQRVGVGRLAGAGVYQNRGDTRTCSRNTTARTCPRTRS